MFELGLKIWEKNDILKDDIINRGRWGSVRSFKKCHFHLFLTRNLPYQMEHVDQLQASGHHRIALRQKLDYDVAEVFGELSGAYG